MTRYLPIEQPIFFRNAAADVVDDQISFGPIVPIVRDETDMGHALAVEIPCDDIARLIITTVGRDSDSFALPSKKRLQIGNTAMVDIRVCTGKTPFLRIRSKVRRHIFMNLFLKIDAGVSKSSDDDVRARSCVGGHVAAGVRDHSVVLCVMGSYLKLFVSALDDLSNWHRCNVAGNRPFERRAGCHRTKLMFECCPTTAEQADGQSNKAHYQRGFHKMPLTGAQALHRRKY